MEIFKKLNRCKHFTRARAGRPDPLPGSAARLDEDEKANVGITVLSQFNDEGRSREFTGDNVPTNAKGIGKDA